MSSSGTLRDVGLDKTDVSEEHMSSIFKLMRISDLGTSSVSTNCSHIPEDGIFIVIVVKTLTLYHVSQIKNIQKKLRGP
jgi:hypothetical protein